MADSVTVIPWAGSPRCSDQEAAAPLGPLDFLVGPENRLIDTAVQDVLNRQPTPFNPLVLYGASGTGKSHLAQGLAVAWKRYFPGSRVICKTSADFARELAEAIDTKAVAEFRANYRAADLAVFEDLGELATKQAAQEELIYTLDALLQRGCQIVGTSRVLPCEIPKLLPALASRLAAGLTVPIEPPGCEARREVLRRWVDQRELGVTESDLQLLAQGLSGTVPELIGAMLQLEVTPAGHCTFIDRKRVKEFLDARNSALRPLLADVARATARHFKLRLGEMRGPSRRRQVAAARDVAMYLCRQLTDASFQNIGQHFGGRDHTTVMHACRKTAEFLQIDPAIRNAVEVLQARLSKC